MSFPISIPKTAEQIPLDGLMVLARTAFGLGIGMLAHPVETIPARSDAARRIAEIVREKNAERVVVGLPRHMNGSVGDAARDALAFAEKLRAVLSCEVVTWDERLT
ncbi:MAG: Holliday junction resolvase RuvX, partial [Verrucomicrobiaceae bacterium]|nr:Holliday junction resolvase RuvX [Verrucomicrobiaceae bacterium]